MSAAWPPTTISTCGRVVPGSTSVTSTLYGRYASRTHCMIVAHVVSPHGNSGTAVSMVAIDDVLVAELSDCRVPAVSGHPPTQRLTYSRYGPAAWSARR